MDRLLLQPDIYNLRFLYRMEAIHAAFQREFRSTSNGHGNGCQAIEIAGALSAKLLQMRIENIGYQTDLATAIRTCDLADFAIFNRRPSRGNNAPPQFRCY
ncbi:hypothetical protein [Bradyrhizobium sp. CB3481]|uniref:hypothetical protein n=1 Tax=Bradyrhizobium sp. CB3481 TaxID=3039158 RepID=UPI0024B201C9|nr:hypothetical protein [Bradyrhizobium sp. CB3481]WFU15372.1 hypothetical protein QA643_30990 [Bradyrhizobium sp. CB3481]